MPHKTNFRIRNIAQWERRIKDIHLRALIAARGKLLAAAGSAGKVKPVDAGVGELRIHFGRAAAFIILSASVS